MKNLLPVKTVNTNSDKELEVKHYGFNSSRATFILAANATIQVIHSLEDVYELRGKNLKPLPTVETEKEEESIPDFSQEVEGDSENLRFRV